MRISPFGMFGSYWKLSGGVLTTTYTISAAGGSMASVADDTTPQLGGDLDTNGFDIGLDTSHGIVDENGNEQLLFTTTAAAVNYAALKNAATGNAVQLQALGDDPNVSFNIVPKGAGTVQAGGVEVATISGSQTLTNKTLTAPVLSLPQVNDTSADHQYVFAVSELTADRTITLPLLTGDDTFVFLAAEQTLTNKTLTSPVLTTPQINDTSADHQYVLAVSELAADRTVTLPLLTGDDTFVFAAFAQTLTNKTLTSPILTTPQINDTSADHQYVFAVSELTADRTVTLPLLTGDDTFVFASFTQTLANKTLTAPKIADGGFIADANGNEQVKFVTTADAVNEITITNAATGNGPSMAVSGGDSNADFTISAKGTGYLKPGSNIDINEKSILCEFGTLASDTTASGEIISATAGENVAFGDVCYFKSDGKFWKTDADAEATSKGMLAMAIATISGDAAGLFLKRGYARKDAWNWTVAAELWLDTATAGGMTETKPSGAADIVRLAGYAKAADYVEFDPSKTYIEIGS